MRPLQDQCEPTPSEDLARMFEADMGVPLDAYFSEFDARPIGVASLAQVHVGRLRGSGEKVADLNITFISFDSSSVRFPKGSEHCRHEIELRPVGGRGFDDSKHEAFVRHSIPYFWDMTHGRVGILYKCLNQKRVAWFGLPKLESGEVRLAVGDELRLKYNGTLHKPWEGDGHVIKIPNSKL